MGFLSREEQLSKVGNLEHPIGEYQQLKPLLKSVDLDAYSQQLKDRVYDMVKSLDLQTLVEHDNFRSIAAYDTLDYSGQDEETIDVLPNWEDELASIVRRKRVSWLRRISDSVRDSEGHIVNKEIDHNELRKHITQTSGKPLRGLEFVSEGQLHALQRFFLADAVELYTDEIDLPGKEGATPEVRLGILVEKIGDDLGEDTYNVPYQEFSA